MPSAGTRALSLSFFLSTSEPCELLQLTTLALVSPFFSAPRASLASENRRKSQQIAAPRYRMERPRCFFVSWILARVICFECLHLDQRISVVKILRLVSRLERVKIVTLEKCIPSQVQYRSREKEREREDAREASRKTRGEPNTGRATWWDFVATRN